MLSETITFRTDNGTAEKIRGIARRTYRKPGDVTRLLVQRALAQMSTDKLAQELGGNPVPAAGSELAGEPSGEPETL